MEDISPERFIAVEWILVAICIFFVVARLAVRTWKRMWKFWVSEVWLIIAVMSFTTLVIGTTYTWTTGEDDYSIYSGEAIAKWEWSVQVIFDSGFFFPRFCLLAFYNELFPITEEGLRKCLYLVIAFNVCALIATAMTDIFWCGLPVSQNWVENPKCSIMSTIKVVYVTWTIGMIAELLVFALPFGMLRTLIATPRGEKIALACLFGIGIMTIAMSTARIAFTAQSIYTRNTTIVGSAEIVSQIIVCAAPALRPLLPVMSKGWHRLKSSITGSTASSDDDERTLHGSYSTSGGREKGTNRTNEDELPDLGNWNPEAGNTTEITHSR